MHAQVDLAMARLPVTSVTDDLDLYDDRVLLGLDESTVRSINGVLGSTLCVCG